MQYSLIGCVLEAWILLEWQLLPSWCQHVAEVAASPHGISESSTALDGRKKSEDIASQEALGREDFG